MLVCNVSARARRTLAVNVVEGGQAADSPAMAPTIVEALVDDPASASETVNTYIGDIMLEAASASDSINAGSNYAVAVDEAAIAADGHDGTISGAIPSRSAMVPGPRLLFINPGTSRQAFVNSIMINL